MQARTTSKSAYRCDTDVLTREVLEAAREVYARTAREACAVFVHPLDGRALIMAPIGAYGPLVYIGTDGRPRFGNMAMFYDPDLQPGMARVEVCDGCLSMWRDCENSTRRGVDARAAAEVVVDALADLDREWTRERLKPTQQSQAADSVNAREPETPPAPAAKRTRRASQRELERRAATAARKAAEAAEKAERARRTLEEGAADE